MPYPSRLTPNEIHGLFKRQKDFRWTMSATTSKQRKNKLLALKSEIKNRREDIKAALYSDFKKPYPESELTEIHTVFDEINFAVKNLNKWMRIKKVKTPIVLFGARSYIQYEAKGVVLILAPWNYPFALMMNPLIAAIAAGNCVIGKPSEKTPATSLILKEIIERVFKPEEVSLVLGDAGVAQDLLELPFDHIFFTGSPQVGKKVMLAASKNLTPVTLELGGKSPVIIDQDADLHDAVKKIAWGKFINGGQTCVAPDYVFIHEDHKNKFYDQIKNQIEDFYGKTQQQELSSDFARIIDSDAFIRLKNSLSEQFLPQTQGWIFEKLFIPPTVLMDVKSEDTVMQNEIFGPLLPVLIYKNPQEIIDLIRSQTKPLALYIFSKDKKFIKHILHSTTSGGAAVNHVVLHLANPHLPFGGVGHSGMGSYHGHHGFKTFSHEKSILLQGKISFSSFYFPPYEHILKRIAFKILRLLE